jgi:hypothetical protein
LIIDYRGLPSGYLANIEERLAQTEVALLQALSTLHASGVQAQLDQHQPRAPYVPVVRTRELEFNEVRIARVEEWKSYPLETPVQLQRWMQSRLSTTEAPLGTDSAERWDEPAELTSKLRKRRRHEETGQAANERHTAASEGRDPLELEADHGSDFIVSTASPSMARPVRSMHDDLAADPFHDNRLSALSAAVSTLQHQNTNISSPTLRSISETPYVEAPYIPGTAQEEQPEQYISKAKKLVSSHSRRYF